MSSPLSRLKSRLPVDVRPNPKLADVPAQDTPPEDKKRLPDWAKWIIGTNMVMIHLVVILTGLEFIPFALNDASLAAYIVVGLGIPVGLASHTIRGALAALFNTKS